MTSRATHSAQANRYRCGHCGYEGPCYGTPTGTGVSAPWCKQCQRNDKLEVIAGVAGVSRDEPQKGNSDAV